MPRRNYTPLVDADLVVRGILGEPRSYLSDDQRDIYSDYPIVNAVVLFQREIVTSLTPRVPTISVTQLGGTVKVGNLQFTQTELGLPPLKPGTEGLFVLKRIGEKYHIGKTFCGAFEISNGTVTPLAKRDFAPEYRGASVTQVVEDILTNFL